MRCLSVRILLPLVVVAAIAGCSGSGSSGKPSAESPSSDSASPATASSQSANSGRQKPMGRVAGEVLYVGGPPWGIPRPVQGGTITFTGAVTFKAPVNTRGAFSAYLSPGTYRVTATSPDVDSGSGVCLARRPVPVTDGGSASVKLYCQIK